VRKNALLVVLLLLAAVAAVYGQTLGFDFLIHDDRKYVTDNPHVREGLTVEGIGWAFTSMRASNWHPLTWISHMKDCQLFGLEPAGHHFTNVLLHCLNALLLFGLLMRMTGRMWPSSIVAALFALHPLHVESVAWIAERKDLLSATFALLATFAYVAYARRGGAGRYLLVVLLMALGLMAKPMIVTLPFVFLLLDCWPLRRLERSFIRPLIEKLPLLLLSAISSIMTVIAQHRGGAVASMEAVAFPLRLANAVVSYARYIWKSVWPAGLTIHYPHPDLLGGEPWRWWQVGGACLLLIIVSVMIFRAKERRYLLVGWLWFLGMLVPVLGLVQVGPQAMADRYTYLPLIGLFLMVVWGGAEIVSRHRRAAAVVVIVVLAIFTALSFSQARHWCDSVALFEHALEITPGNPVVHNYLGVALQTADRSDEALEQYRAAVQAAPSYAAANYNLGNALFERGDLEAAVVHLGVAARLDASNADALTNYGNALLATGRTEEAFDHYRRALDVDSAHAGANYNLGLALHRQGKLAEAIEHYRLTLRSDPDHLQAHNNLGLALQSLGRLDEAIAHYRRALSIDPNHANSKRNLERALLSR
jgi:Flp pilus assembly protein TadD